MVLPLAQGTILPPWLVLPVSGLTMLVVATHVLATHAADMPLRRRRLRVANGLLMLFVTALLAYALGVAAVVQTPAAQPAETREFVLVWLTIVGLLAIVIALASADALITALNNLGARRSLRRDLRHGLSRDLSLRRAPAAPVTEGPPRADR